MEDQSFATKIANHIIFCARTRENRAHSNWIIIFISKLTYLKYNPPVAIVKRDIWFLRYSSLFFLGSYRNFGRDFLLSPARSQLHPQCRPKIPWAEIPVFQIFLILLVRRGVPRGGAWDVPPPPPAFGIYCH